MSDSALAARQPAFGSSRIFSRSQVVVDRTAKWGDTAVLIQRRPGAPVEREEIDAWRRAPQGVPGPDLAWRSSVRLEPPSVEEPSTSTEGGAAVADTDGKSASTTSTVERTTTRLRRLSSGGAITVGKNHGVRKVCRCGRRRWAKCAHAWHFAFQWKGRAYRFSLDRQAGRRIETRTEAEALADRLRLEIRTGRFGREDEAQAALLKVPAGPRPKTLRELSDRWTDSHGKKLASRKLDVYRFRTINGFVLPGPTGEVLGAKPADSVTLLDVESFRDWRKDKGLSAVAVNHDLRLLRKMYNWAIRKGLVTRTPFKIGSEPAIQLEREIPRNKRLSEDEEQRLLSVAEPLLRDVVVAILETACRPGELRSLQWRDVSLERRELVVRATKSKTRTERLVPLSVRLLGVLEMRRHGPDGRVVDPDAYVFGNAIGEQVKTFRPAWERARIAAKLGDLHLADLRHEAASRFDEAGVPINFVSKILGHTDLSTTSRYLNIHRRGLHLAMEKFEEARRLANGLQTDAAKPPASEAEPATAQPRKSLVFQ